ncbi:MAG TPA: glycosyltransferase family 4 protein, partial [Urbifossiella sp.]
MKIAFITSGAAGMFCGSCMRDNTLVAALRNLGHDALLIPTYTPIRTDEPDLSERRVFFGGINVYLEQKTWLFRHTPWFVDRLLNFNRLLRWVSPLAVRTKYSELGQLTISMLQGTHGKQSKEVAKLAGWLAQNLQPDVVILSNALLSGMLAEVKRSLGVPIFVTLQGDDIFLEALPREDRRICIELIRKNDAAATGYICTSRFYADFMAEYLGVDRAKMHVVYPGINQDGHGGEREIRHEELTIGYFARICPEKGFHNLVHAFIHLRRMPGAPSCRLRASGWLGANHRHFFEEQVKKLQAAGLADSFEHVECPTHDDKVRFLQSIDLLSVPTTYHEPKGLYVLEAWANGIPVV